VWTRSYISSFVRSFGFTVVFLSVGFTPPLLRLRGWVAVCARLVSAAVIASPLRSTRSFQKGRAAFRRKGSDWRRCHRRLIADFLTARGHEVVHLIRPGQKEAHVLFPDAEVRDGTLYLCGELVA
jgi:hypothetical protein